MWESDRRSAVYDHLAAVLLGLIVLSSLVHGSNIYPVFMDVYYHMATVEGFRQAGGVVLRDYWSFAPEGRPHIYAPFVHALGFLLSHLNVNSLAFGAGISWLCYPLSLLCTWRWLRGCTGPRAALLSLALLAGPERWLFNQTAHTANAVALVLAPLAFLAFQRRKFMTCGLLTTLALYSHGAGMVVPITILLFGLLGRKAGPALRCSLIPLAFVAPWFLHVIANRALIGETRHGRRRVLAMGDLRDLLDSDASGGSRARALRDTD